MAEVTVKVKLDSLRAIADPKKVANQVIQSELGDSIKELSLKMVEVGKSPVKGHGRFERYAAQREDASGNYPEDSETRRRYPLKKTRPVNLELDGSYLEAITRWKPAVGGIEYGLINGSELHEKMFESHNEGKRSDIPQRKVVPTGKDDFTGLIRKKIKDIYLQRIRNIIRSGG